MGLDMPHNNTYIRSLHRYLSDHDLKPAWAEGLTLFDKLPRLHFEPTEEPDRSIFKYEIIIEVDQFPYEQDVIATIWIIENLDGPWTTEDWGEFYFKDKKDAMYFRLVWG